MTAVAAALSEHPTPAEAVGEVVGAILDAVGPEPDLAALFVSRSLVGAVDDIAGAVQALLRPGALIGAAASRVIGGGREAEGGPAVALWAARTGPVLPVRITAEAVDGGVRVLGVPRAAGQDGPRTLVLLADPFTLPLDALLATMATDIPELTVVGGMASAAQGPGGNRLVLGGEVHRDGAVGVLLPPGTATHPVVAQGSRPVGDPMIVTASDGAVLLGLAGQPALDRLLATAATLGPDDRAALEARPQVGVVVDETRATFTTGDFLVRDVVGADPERRGVAIAAAQVPVGHTVQFHVRDPAAAHRELHRLLGSLPAADPAPGQRGALVFTCAGRGPAFFGDHPHDAGTVADVVGPAVAGMACAGEVGPTGAGARVQAHTASVLVLDAEG